MGACNTKNKNSSSDSTSSRIYESFVIFPTQYLKRKKYEAYMANMSRTSMVPTPAPSVQSPPPPPPTIQQPPQQQQYVQPMYLTGSNPNIGYFNQVPQQQQQQQQQYSLLYPVYQLPNVQQQQQPMVQPKRKSIRQSLRYRIREHVIPLNASNNNNNNKNMAVPRHPINAFKQHLYKRIHVPQVQQVQSPQPVEQQLVNQQEPIHHSSLSAVHLAQQQQQQLHGSNILYTSPTPSHHHHQHKTQKIMSHKKLNESIGSIKQQNSSIKYTKPKRNRHDLSSNYSSVKTVNSRASNLTMNDALKRYLESIDVVLTPPTKQS